MRCPLLTKRDPPPTQLIQTNQTKSINHCSAPKNLDAYGFIGDEVCIINHNRFESIQVQSKVIP